MKEHLLTILAALSASAIVGAVIVLLAWGGPKGNSEVLADTIRPPTQVCGSFMQPDIVAGIPIEVTDSTILFEDGYLLKLDQTLSMYINRIGYFELKEGKIARYALVTKTFNPCPRK